MATMHLKSREGIDAATPPLTFSRKRKLDADASCYNYSKQVPSSNTTSPHQCVIQAFLENGHCIPEDSASLSALFKKPSDAQIEAYKLGTLKAVRLAQINELRKLHAMGVSFDCCNRFGESLVSLVCRKGNADALRFLVQEAGVSLLLRDDFGRTVLHDAFWTTQPEFELITFLLQEVPDLLFVKDVRGHTPLDYVRREHWGIWINFLKERKHLLRPKLLA
jgi:hypothetical protein